MYVLCAYVPCEHRRNCPGLVLSTTWARLGIFYGIGLSPPHPSPCFPTLSIRQSPAQKPRVQQLSQRTSWYSQAPAVEEKDIRPYTSDLSSQHPFYGREGSQ